MAPCDWPVSYAACITLPGWSPEDQAAAEQMATDLLWAWTGKGFGLCEVSVRPCRADCSGAPDWFWGHGPRTAGIAAAHSGGSYGPALIGGQWFNVTCGSCGDDCSCGMGPSTLRLPGPVAEVSEVDIGGVGLDASAYRVDNAVLLVRTDGGLWPRCQDLGAAAHTPNSFTITYLRGSPVPAGGQVAAGVLATEVYRAVCRDSRCALPQRLQSITRQGVTVAVLDDFSDVSKGRTGIWLIDAWVASVVNSPRASRVYSVDIPRPRNRIQTWPVT